MDVGALTPFLWGFEEREKLMEIYERVSGARMHAAYIRPGGIAWDIPLGTIEDIFQFTKQLWSRLDELDELLTKNIIWINRLKNIGKFSSNESKSYNFSGVLLRSCGINWDLRKNKPYEVYNDCQFNIPITTNGDCYDRYLIRLEEMRQSLIIIMDCIKKIPNGPVRSLDWKKVPPYKKSMKRSMENVINHFKYFSSGFEPDKNMIYIAVEAPKGEFGVFFKFKWFK